MDYRHLGRSGLEVSRLGLGAIPFGTTFDDAACSSLVDLYADAGGNWVDTSNFYGGGMKGSTTQDAGRSERAVGNALKGRRDKFVIATKGYWLMEDDWTPNSVGLSRTYLAKNIEGSLRRLQTDYIDLYQCHNRDLYTPVEETMRVLDDFVRAGKIRYVGVSNWDGWHVVKANTFARQNGLTPIISNQIWYNMADRSAENSITPACCDQGVGVMVWGALAEGFLAGKYKRGDKKPVPGAKIRLALDDEMWSWESMATERTWNILDVLAKISKDRDRSMANIATRWLLDASDCDVVLVGASRMEQFRNNMEVLDFKLTDAEIQELNEVSRPDRTYPHNFHDLFCRKGAPNYGGLR